MHLFPVATFKRVFDTEVKQEVITLRELTRAMRRFELKTGTAQQTEREYKRIEKALQDAKSGQIVGKRSALIQEKSATQITNASPETREQALHAAAMQLKEARDKAVKQDLRLWSPVLYRSGAERGSDGVSHVSCLVLDYDSGVPFSRVHALYADHYFVMHTTWSHTPEHPRFRVILPLAYCVKREHWDRIWDWVWDKSDHEIDLMLKSAAANFALPATGARDAVFEAYTHAAPLLDPGALGVPPDPDLILQPKYLPDSMMLGSRDKTYIEFKGDDAAVYDLDLELDTALDAELLDTELDAPTRDVPPTPAPNPEPGPPKKNKRKRKLTIAVDFDGVLHSYTSGWQGGTVIPDPPVTGAIAWLERLGSEFTVAIFSSRNSYPGAISEMKNWFLRFGLSEPTLKTLKFPKNKPPAHIYIDDRAYRFEGIFPTANEIAAFEPWRSGTPQRPGHP